MFKFKKSFQLLCLLATMIFGGVYVKAKDTIIVAGYSYDEVGPHIILCNLDKKEYHKQYLNGQMINLTKSGPRYCVGTYNLVDFSSSPCPYKRRLDPHSKINHCSECYRKIGFNPSYYNATQISPQQLEYNNTPHVVYLAYFSPTCVKVGTASLKRASLRLLEQGAKAAFILKIFPNAYQARELEASIVYGGFGILEGVTQKQKADILCTDRYNSKTAFSVLTEFLRLLKIVPESSFLDLYPKYFYDTEVALTYPDKTRLFSDSLIGEAVGMVGDMVIIRQKDRFFPITKFMGWGSMKCESGGVPLENAVFFETPWAAPIPIFEKLTQIFPDTDMELIWAGEDIGHNVGKAVYENGNFYIEEYDAETDGNTAFDIYIELWGEDDCLQLDKDGNWQIVYE